MSGVNNYEEKESSKKQFQEDRQECQDLFPHPLLLPNRYARRGMQRADDLFGLGQTPLAASQFEPITGPSIKNLPLNLGLRQIPLAGGSRDQCSAAPVFWSARGRPASLFHFPQGAWGSLPNESEGMERREGARGLRGPFGQPLRSGCPRALRGRAPACEAGCAPLALHPSSVALSAQGSTAAARIVGAPLRAALRRLHDRRRRADPAFRNLSLHRINVKTKNVARRAGKRPPFPDDESAGPPYNPRSARDKRRADSPRAREDMPWTRERAYR